MQSAGDYDPQSVLEILTPSNPKRRETIAWHQYDFLENNEGCTLEELRHRAQRAASNNPEIYRDKNWLIPELNWCLERDFIRLEQQANTMKHQITQKHVEQAASEVDKYGVDWLYDKTGRNKAKTNYVLIDGKSYPSKALGFRVHQIATGSESKENIMTTHEAEAPLKKLGYKLISQAEHNALEQKARPPEAQTASGEEKKLARNPTWSEDELSLCLDMYLRNRASIPGKNSDEVKKLSHTLNRLGELEGNKRSALFRNTNGVYMKLMNFRRLDPAFPDTKGLPNGGKGEEEIWKMYANSPNELATRIAAILTAIEADDRGELPSELDFDPDFTDAPEGKAITRVHRARERNPKLVKNKKQFALKTFGKLACEACSFDFRKFYGPRGDGFIECHHEIPVSSLRPGQKTHIKDLRLVCANCHRMIHSKRPWLTVDELKQVLAQQRRK